MRKGRAIKLKVQADYDVTAPIPTSVGSTSEERARIAQAFFDLPLFAEDGGTLDWQIDIVDNFVSLCTGRERQPRKPDQLWDVTSSSGYNISDIAINLGYSDSSIPPRRQFHSSFGS